jgi:hypothetical protein
MNYDLAVMALEGMARAPLEIRVQPDGVSIEGSAASMKELARLCLLLAGEPDVDDAVELAPGTHVTKASPMLRLKVLCS